MAAAAVVFSLLEVAGKPLQVFNLVALGGGPGPLPPDVACGAGYCLKAPMTLHVELLSQLLVAGYPTALQAVWHDLVVRRVACCLRPSSLCSLCQGPISSSVPPWCGISIPRGLGSSMAMGARAVGVPVAWQSGHSCLPAVLLQHLDVLFWFWSSSPL